MEPPPRACSCGSPTSDSETEGGGTLPPPPKPEHGCKRLGGPERAPSGSPPSPCTGKRPRKGEGGKPQPPTPSDADLLFAQKCRELGGFIQPLEELLEGLKRGRYDRGLSSFQQSVAMDRLQRIIGVLQNPEMGARYLATLLQVEGMLRVWFPHVTPKPPPPDSPAPLPRRRPPSGPSAAPRCRRPPHPLPMGPSRARGPPKCHRPPSSATPDA